jgi:hypothetical protein
MNDNSRGTTIAVYDFQVLKTSNAPDQSLLTSFNVRSSISVLLSNVLRLCFVDPRQRLLFQSGRDPTGVFDRRCRIGKGPSGAQFCTEVSLLGGETETASCHVQHRCRHCFVVKSHECPRLIFAVEINPSETRLYEPSTPSIGLELN